MGNVGGGRKEACGECRVGGKLRWMGEWIKGERVKDEAWGYGRWMERGGTKGKCTGGRCGREVWGMEGGWKSELRGGGQGGSMGHGGWVGK